ncbi:MAG: RNA polymerase sigma factor [Candidatus Dormibacteria bacterium]
MYATGYRAGARDDFDRLYRDSYEHVLHTLIGMLRDRTAAEECLQEAFVRAFKAWPRWRSDAPAEAWLLRIAINTASSYRRRERLRTLGETVRRLGRPSEGQSLDPTHSTEVLDAVRRLPTAQAATIVLRFVHGYTNREIAASLGVAESTIASRLAAAKARLRADLEGAGGAILEPSR